MNRYSKEFIDYVRRHRKMQNYKLIELLAVEFPQYEMTKSRITNLRRRYNLQSGIRYSCFKKGHIPHNKGVPMSTEKYEKCKATMFKKGQQPTDTKPLGYERDGKDGYVSVKIKERAEVKRPRDCWKLKHVLIYEQAHNIKVPKGNIVTFLDGNNRNFDIDNLAMISKNENIRLNQEHLRFDDQELTKTGINIVKLKIAIKDKKC